MGLKLSSDTGKERVDNVTFRVCCIDGQWSRWDEDEPIADIVPRDQTGSLTLAPISNKKYQAYLKAQMLPLGDIRRKRRGKGDSDGELKRAEAIEAGLNRALAKYIITNWEEFISPNGDDNYPPTEKNKVFQLANDVSFREMVIREAEAADHILKEVVDDQVKN